MPHSLPEAEADVLAALYERGDATARDIRLALQRRRPLAHASVATLLQRLEARGLVRRRKGDTGKAFVYSPTRARGRAFAGSLTRAVNVLRRGFGGSSAALVAELDDARRRYYRITAFGRAVAKAEAARMRALVALANDKGLLAR